MEIKIAAAMFLCMMLAALCFAHSIVFALMKEKCIWLVRSYKTLPKEEREKYSVEKICAGGRNILLLWGVWFVIGAAACYAVTPYIAAVFVVIWIILLANRMKFSEKRYEKYRKEED